MNAFSASLASLCSSPGEKVPSGSTARSKRASDTFRAGPVFAMPLASLA